MSKQHTPTPKLNLGFDEDGNVYAIIQGDRDIAYMACQGEQGKKDGERILKACNNHERLVESLERTSNALQRVTLSARSSNTTLTELKQSLEVYQESKQLLTELKQQ